MRLTLICCLILLALASATVASQPPARLKSAYRIAFDSDRDGNKEIYVMDPDGSHQQRLTHTPGKGKNSCVAAWSPDRRKIAFESDRDGNEEIYVMDADGSNVRRLTQTAGQGKWNWNPAWSPMGRRLLSNPTGMASGKFR
jgi:TolB protein